MTAAYQVASRTGFPRRSAYMDLKAPSSALRDMLSTVPVMAPGKLQAKRPVASTLPVNLPLDDSDWKM